MHADWVFHESYNKSTQSSAFFFISLFKSTGTDLFAIDMSWWDRESSRNFEKNFVSQLIDVAV